MKTITTETFLHPGDEAAIKAIRSIPFFEKLLDFISKNSFEKVDLVQRTCCSLQLTENNAPKIMQMYERICKAFGLDEIPTVFLRRSYSMQNEVVGIHSPCILISSSVLASMNEEELETFLVADIAGFSAGHGTYAFIRRLITEFGALLPVPKEVLEIFLTAMNTWAKQRFYTYDRARMLYSDNYDLVMRLIGFGEAPKEIMAQTDLDARIEQARSFSQMTGLQSGLKTATALTKDKPWNAMRLAEMYNWVESGIYADIKEELQ